MRQLPPYSRHVKDALEAGHFNEIYIFIGQHAWKKGQNFSAFRPALVLPPWHSAQAYDWSLVKYRHLLIIDTGYSELDYFDEIARECFMFEAVCIAAINDRDEFFKYHK